MNLVTELSYLTAVIGSGVAAYYDLKTTYIPDWLTHAMIILGVVFVFLQFSTISALEYLGIAAAVFGIGFVAYTLGQLGGGDVKLYTALALLVPTFNTIFKFPKPPYPPIVSIFFASAIFGSIVISFQYITKLIKDRHDIDGFDSKITTAAVSSGLFVLLGIIFVFLQPGFSFILFALAFGVFIYPFKDDLMHMYALEYKRVSDLTEDDIIATDVLGSDKSKKLGLTPGRRTYLSFELDKIKKNARKFRITKVPVYENLPTFGVYIFLGVLFTILFGDMVFVLFSLF